MMSNSVQPKHLSPNSTAEIILLHLPYLHQEFKIIYLEDCGAKTGLLMIFSNELLPSFLGNIRLPLGQTKLGCETCRQICQQTIAVLLKNSLRLNRIE
ncbi:uncharacterized [Tachysurus ichikawai]